MKKTVIAFQSSKMEAVHPQGGTVQQKQLATNVV
jgi:hypothetical protein